MTYSPPIIPTSSTLSNLSLDDSSAPTTVATPSVSSLYTSSLLHLDDFSTIESWARLTNHLSTVPPSMLSKGGNFQLFKKGVEPIFEGSSRLFSFPLLFFPLHRVNALFKIDTPSYLVFGLT